VASSVTFVPIQFEYEDHAVEAYVASDYLLENLNTGELSSIVEPGYRYKVWSQVEVDSYLSNHTDFLQPNSFIVDKVFANATCKLDPKPMNPAGKNSIEHHSDTLIYLYYHRCDNKRLIVGGKKDLVVSPKQGRTALYGWHRPDGSIIQPFSLAHYDGYKDYSHGFRPLLNHFMINGKLADSNHPVVKKFLSE
jgi:hypothetical protein